MQKHIVDRLNDAVAVTDYHGMNELLLDASSKIKDLLNELERFHLLVARINTSANKLVELTEELSHGNL